MALRLSAVQVVTTFAPSTASDAEPAMRTSIPSGARLRASFSLAARSTSKTRTARRSRTARTAKVWNSAWEPAPIKPRSQGPAGARSLVASPEVAAVRRAVNRVISASKRGYPLWTSARTPNAVTVW